ncbi:hypothetical protein J2754_001195 [Halarchaeum solikamskense]|uniref:hypothetical protein n=1 Tax=Halarchaeum nitratireducens TaxID=489913 RepID=UPI001B3B1B13|nr:hypothetical protein [Halarchaeum solikamskense]MBP2250878.1 hypothetical protein [Halarchaeum solikamskense]
MSLHEFPDALREHTNAGVLAGWLVVAVAVTFWSGESLGGFTVLAASGVAVPFSAALADAFDVPYRSRKAASGATLCALGVAIADWGVDAHAVLLVLVGVGAAVVGVRGLFRALRDLDRRVNGETV